MEVFIYRYAYALLAVTHAERSAELYLIAYVVLCDKILELFYYLTGSLDVAGAADAYCNLNHFFFLSKIGFTDDVYFSLMCGFDQFTQNAE